MKKRNSILAALSIMALLFALFTLFYQTKPTTTVSAENLFNKLTTVTPYATSIPDISVRVLQKYAYSEILTSSAHGFEISVTNFRVEGNELKVDACHQNPNNREWTFGEAIIQSGAEKLYVTSYSGIEMARTFSDGRREIVRFLENVTPNVEKSSPTGGGEDNYRCDTLSFRVNPDMILSHVKLTIEYINANLYEGEWCYENRESVQSILDAKGAHIKIDCSKNDAPGQSSSKFVVVEKPNAVSQEEAMNQVTSAFSESLIIKGPWVFQGEVMNVTETAPTDAPVEPLVTDLPAQDMLPEITPTP